jgi:hypothetical protein
MEKVRKQKMFAWIAILIAAVFTNLWAFWGIVENFHEGWYFRSLWQNVVMMFGQYLLFPLVIMILTVVSIKWNKVGSILHLVVGIFVLWFFRGGAGMFLLAIPLLALAILYWFGKLEKKKLAYILVVGIPLLIILGFGIFHGIRVAGRLNDDNFEARLIKGNGVDLIWAPQGPGWPDNGTNWANAKNICAHLRSDGESLSDSVLNIWRLPTIDEAVRSQVHHGENAKGVWDVKTKTAAYQLQPDKESPLWNMYLKTVYWWTLTEVNEKQAYIIVYDGGVWPRMKTLNPAYLNFRAVKEVK